MAFFILEILPKIHIYQLLFTNCVLIFSSIFIFIIQTKFVFLFIIAIINRLFFYFVITLGYNGFSAEGAEALAEALKLNKNLTLIELCKFMLLFQHIITVI